MVYALQKFRHYLLGSHFKMFTDHSALKYLVNKPVLGGRICRWLILFQEYDFEIIVKPGRLNLGPVDVYVTSECILLCIVTRCLFRDVSIMYLSHVILPRCFDRED